MKKSTSRAGISLLESIVVIALMSILMIFLAEALRQSQKSFRQTSGSSDASLQLRKVATQLSTDLCQTQTSMIGVAPVPVSLVAPDGDAVWFLSNRSPDTGAPVFRADGSPFWQRNILYYLIIPQNHDALFGQHCAGGLGPDGRDDRCPHKVLVRKEIDTGADAAGADEDDAEKLIPAGSVAAYLTRPQGYQTGFMLSEPGVRQARLAAQRLLGFRVNLNNGAVYLDLRAAGIPRAQREIALGSAPLYDSAYTYHFSQAIVPNIP